MLNSFIVQLYNYDYCGMQRVVGVLTATSNSQSMTFSGQDELWKAISYLTLENEKHDPEYDHENL